MGRRRRDGQGPGREEQLAAGAPAHISEARAGGGNVRDHLLSLQRDYGNGAVTSVIQRKGGGKKGPKPKHEENFAPTSLHYNGTKDVQKSMAMDYWQGTNGKSMDLEKAAKYMEDVWFLEDDDGQARSVALNVARIWKEWSEPKRYAFWIKVHTGEIKPKEGGSKRHA
jgi:hypothetical protein